MRTNTSKLPRISKGVRTWIGWLASQDIFAGCGGLFFISSSFTRDCTVFTEDCNKLLHCGIEGAEAE